VRIHTERTARLLSAIRAVATPDMHRVTSERCSGPPRRDIRPCVLLPPQAQMLGNTAVGLCAGMSPKGGTAHPPRVYPANSIGAWMTLWAIRR